MAEQSIVISDGKINTGFEAISQGLASFEHSMDKVLAIRANMALGENMDETQYEDPEMARKLMMVGMTQEAQALRKKLPDDPTTAVMWAMERFARDPSDANAMAVDAAKRNYEYFKDLELSYEMRKIAYQRAHSGGPRGDGGDKISLPTESPYKLGEVVGFTPEVLSELGAVEAEYEKNYNADLEKYTKTVGTNNEGWLGKAWHTIAGGEQSVGISDEQRAKFNETQKQKLMDARFGVVKKYVNKNAIPGVGNLAAQNVDWAAGNALMKIDQYEGFSIDPKSGSIRRRSTINPTDYPGRAGTLMEAKLNDETIQLKKSTAKNKEQLLAEDEYYGRVRANSAAVAAQQQAQALRDAYPEGPATVQEKEAAGKEVKGPGEAWFTLYNNPKFAPVIDAAASTTFMGKQQGTVDVNSLIAYINQNPDLVKGWNKEMEIQLRNYFDSTGLGSKSYHINFIKGIAPVTVKQTQKVSMK